MDNGGAIHVYLDVLGLFRVKIRFQPARLSRAYLCVS